ncbi:hypothetical protein [Nocardia sp. NPDC052566]|uniref:hypothetical protein n=1 Tax=Nocardia sp. NPDC052566 TaxID=3364330 RepID=UPI0037C5567E
MWERLRRRRDPVTAHVRRVAAPLAVPQPWQLDEFLAQVAAVVGKRIRLHPLPVTEGLPCGLVIERAEDIVIAYDATSSGYHADHIVLHEIGHLLLGHAGADHTDRATLENLFPSVDPATVLRVLARTDYDELAERQAELFASLIMSTARDTPAGSPIRRVVFRD